MFFVQSMVMIEPCTASVALYLVSKSRPMLRSHKKAMGLLRTNRKELLNTAADELAEPALVLMQSMVPSWITLILYLLLWLVVFVV